MTDRPDPPFPYQARQWAEEGARVECFSGRDPSDVIHEGRIIGMTEAPTVRVQKDDGQIVSWVLGITRKKAASSSSDAPNQTAAGEVAPKPGDPAESREGVGRFVRQVWVEWAREQPHPKPSWLLPWEGLGHGQREVDMRIGAALFEAGQRSVEEHYDAELVDAAEARDFLRAEVAQQKSNWDAARAANMTALETIGTLKDERQLLLWLHAEAVWQRDAAWEELDEHNEAAVEYYAENARLRAATERDARIIDRYRGELQSLKANAITLPKNWRDQISSDMIPGHEESLFERITGRVSAWRHGGEYASSLDTLPCQEPRPDTEATEQAPRYRITKIPDTHAGWDVLDTLDGDNSVADSPMTYDQARETSDRLNSGPATPTERAPIWQNPERWPKPCVHGILTGMMVCPVCEPEKQAEAEESARAHAARSQVGWTDPTPATPTEGIDCSRGGRCPLTPTREHHPGCLALTLTEAEQALSVVPSDEELRARLVLTAPAAPTEPRAVYHDPGDVQFEYDEDDKPVDPSVGWDIAWGCRVTLGHYDDRWRVTVSVSDAEKRNGGAIRSVTRQQIRVYAHHLIQLTEVVGDQAPGGES